MRRPTLHARLFASYVAVVVIGAATLVVATRLLAPNAFDHQIAGAAGRGLRMTRGQGATIRSAFVDALNSALLAALAASTAAGVIAAIAVARRLLRPLDAVRAAARRLAAGDYTEQVPVPREPELAALAVDVNALGAALSATEARRVRLIGDVAHEMRTPLTTIQGYVEGMADHLFTADEALGPIGDELARLRRLAADLAELSRAEENALEVDLTEIDLVRVVHEAVNRLRPRFDAKQVALAVDASDGIVVTADGDRLVQAVTNLVGNALDYTAPGGAVTVVAARRDGAARVAVSDTGIGLDADDLVRVFDRFYRAAPEGHAGGTGIGLTIARSIARAHGGDITAASEGPGKGSTFTLSLPCRP